MKIAGLTTPLAVTSCLLLAAAAGTARAHTQLGSLGAGVTATDYYQVTCSDDGSGAPASLIAQVAGGSASNTATMRHLSSTATATATVSVVVHKGNIAITSSDAANGDATPSPFVFVNGADGVYDVFLSKNAGGVVNYTLTFHCMTGANGTGIHTGTDITIKQRSS